MAGGTKHGIITSLWEVWWERMMESSEAQGNAAIKKDSDEKELLKWILRNEWEFRRVGRQPSRPKEQSIEIRKKAACGIQVKL